MRAAVAAHAGHDVGCALADIAAHAANDPHAGH
jgi:hypothetical protein